MFWNKSRTFYNYLKRSARLSSSSRSRHKHCRRTATSTHFWTSRKIYIAQGNNVQDCFGITGYSVYHKIQSQVQTTTRAIFSQNQSPGVSNLQRGWSWQLEDILTLNPLIRANSLYGKRIVGFARVRLLGYSYATLNRFWEKKPTVLQSKFLMLKIMFMFDLIIEWGK